MAKRQRTNNDLQKNTQKTRDRATRSPQIDESNGIWYMTNQLLYPHFNRRLEYNQITLCIS